MSATGGSERFHRVTRRYAPVFLVLMVQALLVAIAPSAGRGPGSDGFAVSSGGAGSRVGGVSTPVTDEGPSAVSGGPGATGPSGGGGTGGPGPAAAGETQAAPTVGIDPNESGPWPWTHSWNLEGDRSKCAEGGQIQETVTVVPIPCVPKFEGDNLGATWDGVTADTITVVIYRGASNPAGDAILGQQDLATSYENEKRAVAVYGEFFNKHYEFYGRKIQWIDYQGLCDGTDASCWRTDVRNMVKQHKPFLVVHDKSVFPEFHDELARLGVPNIGGWHFDSSFRTARRPYTFDLFGDGEISARHTASYWCRKLAGKTAAEAGDPLIRNQTRKMGIVTEDLDVYRLVAEKLTGLVSGGLCGGEPPPVFTYNFDIARGQEQMVAIVAGLKDEDVTTVVCLCEPVMPVFLYSAMDQQQYFPEHLLSGNTSMGHDFLARLYSPTQWENAFGVSMRPKESPKSDADHQKAWRDVGAEGTPPYVTLNTFMYQRFAATLLQWAGPNLNPLTLERGALEAPQIGGWAQADPWPGWKCCNPFVELMRFGPSDYTGHEDAKEVYWSNTATSDIDGGRGTYLCADGPACRRYSPDEWPGGDAPG